MTRKTKTVVEIQTNPKADRDDDIRTYMNVCYTKRYLYTPNMFEEIKQLMYLRQERLYERRRWLEVSYQNYDDNYYEELAQIRDNMKQISEATSLDELENWSDINVYQVITE